jgi:hypothetical protein
MHGTHVSPPSTQQLQDTQLGSKLCPDVAHIVQAGSAGSPTSIRRAEEKAATQECLVDFKQPAWWRMNSGTAQTHNPEEQNYW